MAACRCQVQEVLTRVSSDHTNNSMHSYSIVLHGVSSRDIDGILLQA